MPSVTKEHDPVIPFKKRRRDDTDAAADIHLQLYGRAGRSPTHLVGDAAGSGSLQSNVVVTLKNGGDIALYHASHAEHDGAGDGSNAAGFLVNRRILPVAKRMRIEDDRADESHRNRSRIGSPGSRQQRIEDPALQQTTANAGRTQQQQQQQQQQQTQQQSGSRTTPVVLKPCHICHRRPTKKSDLDSFADCEGCGQRSCFVCIRECLDWRAGDAGRGTDDPLLGDLAFQVPQAKEHPTSFAMEDVDRENEADRRREGSVNHHQQRTGKHAWAASGSGHRQMVCSRCCVERGQDGDVVCLGCLPFVEG